MYKKICPYCKKDSYSASLGRWVCPYCAYDITAVLPQSGGCVLNRANGGARLWQEGKIKFKFYRRNPGA